MTFRAQVFESYELRLRRVIDHIYDHLDEELDVDRLAEIACLSPSHWHRIYRGLAGETITATVKRLRLQRAAVDLSQSTLPIGRVAERAHYPNTQSFNRVFKAVYGLAPAAYRRTGPHSLISRAITRGDMSMYDVRFEKREAMTLIGVDHRGPYIQIGQAFDTLYGLLFSRQLFRPDMEMIGLYFDDPDLVESDQLRSAACVTVPADFKVDAPLKGFSLVAGDYAVLLSKGPYSDLPKAYEWFFGVWLEKSEREIRESPVFELYLNNPRDTAPQDLLTEIWMPIAG